MRQLPSHRVGRDELVVELAGDLLKQQIWWTCRPPSPKPRLEKLMQRGVLDGEHLWQTWLARRRPSRSRRGGPGSTCGFLHSSMLMSMRSIAATEAGCSISNVMLQQQQELLLRHLIAVLAGLGLRQNQRRHRATAPRSARSPAAQAPARPASSALATPSAMTRPKGGRHPGCRVKECRLRRGTP